MCGLFVIVHDEKIALIHQTARVFLMKATQSHRTPSSAWQGCLDMATAHGTISQICVAYLNFDDFASTPQDHSSQDGFTQQDKGYNLVDYAALHWVAHYTSQPSESAKDAQKAAQNLCDTSLPQKSYWFKIYCESTYLKGFDGWTGLGIASLFGLEYVVEGFLHEGAGLNAQAGGSSNALQAASSVGHDQVLQILLDKGAHINA
jgi:hypothetical protein